MASVRIHQRKRVVLRQLSFLQLQMVQIGRVGLADVKRRIGEARNLDDQPAKPLTRNYAIWKTKQGKGNRRNLRFTGEMLQNFTLRTVSEKGAKAAFTSRKQRAKAYLNTNWEPFVGFSPKNADRVFQEAQKFFAEQVRGMVVDLWVH